MSERILLHEMVIGTGLRVRLIDATRHYFGGYYHVRIEVSADVPVSAAFNEGDDAGCADAVALLGDTVLFNRVLERMAVPEAGIEEARTHLVGAFEATLIPYLERGDFAVRFIESRLVDARRSRQVRRYNC